MTSPKNLLELRDLATAAKQDKYKTVPSHAVPRAKPFTDATANGLTEAIIFDIENVYHGVAFRINNIPVFDQTRGAFRKSNMRKGIPDIIATIDGYFVGIEVKIGRDRQSAEQKEVEADLRQSGGIYFVATSYADYLQKVQGEGFFRL
jgi:hypothetical protein